MIRIAGIERHFGRAQKCLGLRARIWYAHVVHLLLRSSSSLTRDWRESEWIERTGFTVILYRGYCLRRRPLPPACYNTRRYTLTPWFKGIDIPLSQQMLTTKRDSVKVKAYFAACNLPWRRCSMIKSGFGAVLSWLCIECILLPALWGSNSRRPYGVRQSILTVQAEAGDDRALELFLATTRTANLLLLQTVGSRRYLQLGAEQNERKRYIKNKKARCILEEDL